MFWLTRPAGVGVAGRDGRGREGAGDIDNVSISTSKLPWGWFGVLGVLGASCVALEGSCVACGLSRAVDQKVLGFSLASLISSHFFGHFTEVV